MELKVNLECWELWSRIDLSGHFHSITNPHSKSRFTKHYNVYLFSRERDGGLEQMYAMTT